MGQGGDKGGEGVATRRSSKTGLFLTERPRGEGLFLLDPFSPKSTLRSGRGAGGGVGSEEVHRGPGLRRGWTPGFSPGLRGIKQTRSTMPALGAPPG